MFGRNYDDTKHSLNMAVSESALLLVSIGQSLNCLYLLANEIASFKRRTDKVLWQYGRHTDGLKEKAALLLCTLV